jgi:hypothetical protein
VARLAVSSQNYLSKGSISHGSALCDGTAGRRPLDTARAPRPRYHKFVSRLVGRSGWIGSLLAEDHLREFRGHPFTTRDQGRRILVPRLVLGRFAAAVRCRLEFARGPARNNPAFHARLPVVDAPDQVNFAAV